VENRKSIKKTDMLQKYQQTVRRIREVSPEEEKEGCAGKD